MTRRVVVTGANRGLGLALARRFAARGDEVHATAREPARARALAALDGVTVHALDVRSDEACEALGRALAPLGSLDVLVNNAGLGEWGDLDDVDGARALELFDVNALGALRVTRALLPLLEAARGKVFHVSSGMGSIAGTDRGGSYAYRMSKAALGMFARALAADVRGKGVASIALDPGWVRTDMGGDAAPLAPDESAAQLVALTDSLGLDESGTFVSRQGAPRPW